MYSAPQHLEVRWFQESTDCQKSSIINHQTSTQKSTNATTSNYTTISKRSTQTKPNQITRNNAFRRLGTALPRQIHRQLLKIFQPCSINTTKLISCSLELNTQTEP
jgi:hypothetical protein